MVLKAGLLSTLCVLTLSSSNLRHAWQRGLRSTLRSYDTITYSGDVDSRLSGSLGKPEDSLVVFPANYCVGSAE